MTREQIQRAAELLHARDAITEFLSCRDPESDAVKSFLESSYDFQRADGRKIPSATVAEISIMDLARCDADTDDPDTLNYWFIPRDILEAGLRAQLPAIAAELEKLGVQDSGVAA